jgi:hypothetical protein
LGCGELESEELGQLEHSVLGGQVVSQPGGQHHFAAMRGEERLQPIRTDALWAERCASQRGVEAGDQLDLYRLPLGLAIVTGWGPGDRDTGGGEAFWRAGTTMARSTSPSWVSEFWLIHGGLR